MMGACSLVNLRSRKRTIHDARTILRQPYSTCDAVHAQRTQRRSPYPAPRGGLADNERLARAYTAWQHGRVSFGYGQRAPGDCRNGGGRRQRARAGAYRDGGRMDGQGDTLFARGAGDRRRRLDDNPAVLCQPVGRRVVRAFQAHRRGGVHTDYGL